MRSVSTHTLLGKYPKNEDGRVFSPTIFVFRSLLRPRPEAWDEGVSNYMRS